MEDVFDGAARPGSEVSYGVPGLSDNAVTVLERRYLKKDKDGRPVERPCDMFRRVAHSIASAETAYDKSSDAAAVEETFYDMMVKLEFLPNSPTLMNAGRRLGQLSACFVLPVEDSMESIFDAIKHTALIHKSGGGTGFSFSRLRPKDDVVSSTKGVSSGPVSFMRVFDSATEAVKQGGTRRGANMGILRVDHPDIIDFITSKIQENKLNNFNISVAITDSFMEAVEKDEEYGLVNPHTKQTVNTLKAREVFDLIVKMAWKNGDPGVIFIDRVNEKNPTPEIGDIESTNPCGEQPLLPYESCNLGSINLAKMVRGREIDFEKIDRVARASVRFLDNVIDVNNYPLPEIERMTRANRKIGLGVMGFADMLVLLGVRYDSEEALRVAEKVMSFVSDVSHDASMRLAEGRGPFPNYAQSVYAKEGRYYRNASTTTIAPTGTLSIISGCSSGIEPLYGICYHRKVLDNTKLIEVHPQFKAFAVEKGFYSDALMQKIEQKGTVQGLDEVPPEVQKVFVTAHDITPDWHIRMQAVFQKYVDNAVSKTVNFPNSATIEDVYRVYMEAYKRGCKGVTIYRDGSRDEQVLHKGTGAEKKERKIVPKPRPKVISGRTIKMSTGCGKLYVTINDDENGMPFEIFLQMGKAGGCAASQLEAVGRLCSLALRSGISVKTLTEQLAGIRCPSPSWEKGGKIFSCSDAVSRAIEDHILHRGKDREPAGDSSEDSGGGRDADNERLNVVGVCPDCGDALVHESGCVVCRSCAFSECG